MNIFGIAYVVMAIGVILWSVRNGVAETLREVFKYDLNIDEDIRDVIVILALTAAAVVWPFSVAIGILYVINDKRHTKKEDE